MNLVIDIGNTFTKLGWFEKGKLVRIQRLENPAVDGIADCIRAGAADKIIVSSVGMSNRDLFTTATGDPNSTLFLDITTPIPLTIVYQTPESLGIDRIAAAV